MFGYVCKVVSDIVYVWKGDIQSSPLTHWDFQIPKIDVESSSITPIIYLVHVNSMLFIFKMLSEHPKHYMIGMHD